MKRTPGTTFVSLLSPLSLIFRFRLSCGRIEESPRALRGAYAVTNGRRKRPRTLLRWTRVFSILKPLEDGRELVPACRKVL